jgi:hypothetical protein
LISKSDYDITEAIRFFNKFSVEASYLVPTYIGLEKSIMDATAPFRAYLKLKDIHNYEGQIQGPEGKVKVDAFIVTDSTLIPTSASLYRPVAKGKSGDPRVWFSKLNSYAKPDNLIAIVASESKLFVVNMSRPEIIKSANLSGSPLNKLLTSIGTSTSNIAEELLEKLRGIAKLGWIETITSGDTGVGATLEYCLGIKINSSKNPDYKGIELKTRRNFHNTYFDTMIGANKVEEGCRQLNKKTKERVLFYFQFTDGLFYFELKEDFVLRRDYFKGKAYYFIPVELLSRTEVPRLLQPS